MQIVANYCELALQKMDIYGLQDYYKLVVLNLGPR